VVLSQGGKLPHLPRRLLGKSLHFWGDHLGLIAAPLDSWRGRTQRVELLVGPSLRTLARRHGITLAPRTVHAKGSTVVFSDSHEAEVDAVVWATGYRPDYTWIHLPIFGQDGTPVHRRGVTGAPGLYLLGMRHQYSRGSALIYWVKRRRRQPGRAGVCGSSRRTRGARHNSERHREVVNSHDGNLTPSDHRHGRHDGRDDGRHGHQRRVGLPPPVSPALTAAGSHDGRCPAGRSGRAGADRQRDQVRQYTV